MIYTANFLVERVKQLPEFTSVFKGAFPSDYWIIGIRNSADTPNKFDDTFYLMKGTEIIVQTTGTTNPGTPTLQGGYLKYNKEGAAVVEANRIYSKIWKYGLHPGNIPALLQTGGPVTVYRDGDGDTKSEEIGKKTTGYYGINFHPDQFDISKDTRADNSNVGTWSAGCQVCNAMDDYRKIIELTKTQAVSYVLLHEFSI